jgi:hypothetical protein
MNNYKYIKNYFHALKNYDDFRHSLDVDFYVFKDLVKNYNYNLKNLFRYDKNLSDNSISSLYCLRDYINMSEHMGLKWEKYPKNLKKRHDDVMKIYKYKEAEVKNGAYMKIKDKYLNYEYYPTEGKYFIKIPDNLDEIIKEGDNQNHCVASYIDRVLDEKTFIVFMRDKKHPEKSLLTIEVKDSDIKQIKGKNNREPVQKELHFLLAYDFHKLQKNQVSFDFMDISITGDRMREINNNVANLLENNSYNSQLPYLLPPDSSHIVRGLTCV